MALCYLSYLHDDMWFLSLLYIVALSVLRTADLSPASHSHTHTQTSVHAHTSEHTPTGICKYSAAKRLFKYDFCLSLLMYGADARVCLLLIQKRAEASGDIGVCRLTKWRHKYINFMHIWPFNLSKTILIISYTHKCNGIHGNPSK